MRDVRWERGTGPISSRIDTESSKGETESGQASTIRKLMNTQFTAIIKKEEDWWIGWVEEVSGVNAQERTKEKLIESLKEALLDIIELNREEARREAVSDYEEVSIVA